MTQEIKSCPFCGAQGKETWTEFDGLRLLCKFCGAKGPKTTTDCEGRESEDAIMKWNRRVKCPN